MIRYKEILDAAKEYQLSFEKNHNIMKPTLLNAFAAGAEWADKHTKNPWIKPTFEDCDKSGKLYNGVKQGDIYLCSLGGDDYECSALKLPDGLYMLTTSGKLVAAFDFDFIMKLPPKPIKEDENTSR